MGNDSGSGAGSSSVDSQSGASAVGQTANIGRSTSVSSGAAKVFREFKWGLLTLFLLMVVVIGLVYDGGRKKKALEADAGKPDDRGSQLALEGPESGAPPATVTPPAASPVSAQVSEAGTPPSPSIPSLTPSIPPSITEARPTNEGSGLGTAPTTRLVSTPPTAPTPSLVKPEISAGGEKSYTVKGGDTLTSIANGQLPGKGNLKAILDANKDVLPNPNKLRVGMTLKIPNAIAAVASAPAPKTEKVDKAEKSEKAEPTAKKDPKETATEGHAAPAGEYTVQGGDTLERIARKVFSDARKWRDIYEWNRDQLPDPGRLHVGQVLKIKHGAGATTTSTSAPASASRAEVIEEPVHSGAASPSVAASKSEEPQVMSSSSAANLP